MHEQFHCFISGLLEGQALGHFCMKALKNLKTDREGAGMSLFHDPASE